MDLDGLSRFALAVAIAAVVATFFLGAVPALGSWLAWKWALRKLSERRSVTPARVLALLLLVVSGWPPAWMLVMTFATAAYGSFPLLLVIEAVALGTVTYVAYWHDRIRVVALDTELARKLADVPFAGNRNASIRELLDAAATPVFTDAALRRALFHALLVIASWSAVMALFIAAVGHP